MFGIRENPYGQMLKNANNAKYCVKNGKIMNRRNFLKGMLAVGMAPAICKAEWLMPARNIITPDKAIILPETVIDTGLHNMILGQVYTLQAYVNSQGKGWEHVTKTFKYDGTNGTLPLGKGTKQIFGLQLEAETPSFYNGKPKDWRDGLEIKVTSSAGFKDVPVPSNLVQGHVMVPVITHTQTPKSNLITTSSNFDSDLWKKTKLGGLS
jgi:hypothetical protein